MINLYTDRTKYKFVCKVIKRLSSGEAYGNNEKLIYEDKPSDIFYARQMGQHERNAEVFQNQINVPYQTIILETCDNVTLNKFDKVIYLGKEWIVENSQENLDLSSTEFMLNGGTKTTMIALRK